jgi:hypothetical protein
MPIPRESEIASYLLNQLGVIWSCLDTFAETEDIQFLYYLYLKWQLKICDKQQNGPATRLIVNDIKLVLNV